MCERGDLASSAAPSASALRSSCHPGLWTGTDRRAEQQRGTEDDGKRERLRAVECCAQQHCTERDDHDMTHDKFI
jgi:hypothetical protein